MDRLKTIFKKDQIYTEQLEAYTLRDSVIAAIYYAVILVLYYVMGRVLSATGVYLGSIVSLICMLIPVIICFKKLYMTGISTRNLKPAVIIGFVMGIILLASICIVPNIIAGATVLPFKDIAYNVFYYFFIIGFSEEISFRGFIQPRLFPVFKKEWLMLLAGITVKPEVVRCPDPCYNKLLHMKPNVAGVNTWERLFPLKMSVRSIRRAQLLMKLFMMLIWR